MIKIYTPFLFLLFLLTLACTPTTEAQQETKEEATTVVQQKPAPIHEILSQADFKKELSEEGIVLLDVRTPQEFATGHIEGAINVNVLANDFKTQLEALDLDKGKKVLVYCKSGIRSGRASKAMEEMGFLQIKDLEGGYRAWVKE